MSLPPVRRSFLNRLRSERPPEPAADALQSLFPPRPRPVAESSTPLAPLTESVREPEQIDEAGPEIQADTVDQATVKAPVMFANDGAVPTAAALETKSVPPLEGNAATSFGALVLPPDLPRAPTPDLQTVATAPQNEPASQPTPRPQLPTDRHEAHRVLAEMKRLASVGQPSNALALCERYFGQYRDFLDEYKHPVYLKESIRLLLLLRRETEARQVAKLLQPAVASTDPCVQVLFARHFSRHLERDAARAEWQAVLARDPRHAEAVEWLSAEQLREIDDPIGGVGDFNPETHNDLAGFAGGDRDELLNLYGTLVSPASPAIFAEAALPADEVRRFTAKQVPPLAYVYAVRSGIISGPGFVLRNRQFIAPKGVFPGYLQGRMMSRPHGFEPSEIGALDRRNATFIRVDTPIAAVLHPHTVWGHFLLEMLPRLFLLGTLGRMGRTFPLAIPSNSRDWVKRMAALYVPPASTISYDPKNQCIEAPCVILPSMMQEDGVLHPMFNLIVSDLLARCGIVEGKSAGGPRQVYLSRSRFEGGHRLLNEPEVEATLADMGFAIVHPETLPFEQQVQIFHSADIIVSEYSSALHNALFARRGTRIVALSWVNTLQGFIARLRGQRLALVQPSDGIWRDLSFRGERRHFSVDCAAMRRTVEHMMAT